MRGGDCKEEGQTVNENKDGNFLLPTVTAGESMLVGNKPFLELSYVHFCRLILKSVTNFQNLAPTNVVI